MAAERCESMTSVQKRNDNNKQTERFRFHCPPLPRRYRRSTAADVVNQNNYTINAAHLIRGSEETNQCAICVRKEKSLNKSTTTEKKPSKAKRKKIVNKQEKNANYNNEPRQQQ